MAVLPQASLTLTESANAFGAGNGYIVVMAPVAQSADSVPRVFASTTGLLAQYNYAPGVDYCAMHFAETKTPVIFVGLPIATPGVVQRQDNSAVTGTSQVSIAVGSSGCMERMSGILTVSAGGTVGTSQIVFTLSCDGGESTQTVRLGTASSYIIPN